MKLTTILYEKTLNKSINDKIDDKGEELEEIYLS